MSQRIRRQTREKGRPAQLTEPQTVPMMRGASDRPVHLPVAGQPLVTGEQ